MRFARVRNHFSQDMHHLIRVSESNGASNFCFSAIVKVFIIKPGPFFPVLCSNPYPTGKTYSKSWIVVQQVFKTLPFMKCFK